MARFMANYANGEHSIEVSSHLETDKRQVVKVQKHFKVEIRAVPAEFTYPMARYVLAF